MFFAGPTKIVTDALQRQNKYDEQKSGRVAVVALNETEMATLSSPKVLAKQSLKAIARTSAISGLALSIAVTTGLFIIPLSTTVLTAAFVGTAALGAGWNALGVIDADNAAKLMRKSGLRPVRSVESMLRYVSDERNTNPPAPKLTGVPKLKRNIRDAAEILVVGSFAGITAFGTVIYALPGALVSGIAEAHSLQLNSDSTPSSYDIEYCGKTTEGFREGAISSCSEIPANLQPILHDTKIDVGGKMTDIYPEEKGIFYAADPCNRTTTDQVSASYCEDDKQINLVEHIYTRPQDRQTEAGLDWNTTKTNAAEHTSDFGRIEHHLHALTEHLANHGIRLLKLNDHYASLSEKPGFFSFVADFWTIREPGTTRQALFHEFGHRLFYLYAQGNQSYATEYLKDVKAMGGVENATADGQAYFVQGYNTSVHDGHSLGENEAFAEGFAAANNADADPSFQQHFPHVIAWIKKYQPGWGTPTTNNTTTENLTIHTSIDHTANVTMMPETGGGLSGASLHMNVPLDALHQVSEALNHAVDNLTHGTFQPHFCPSIRLMAAGASHLICVAKCKEGFVGTNMQYLASKTAPKTKAAKNAIKAIVDFSKDIRLPTRRQAPMLGISKLAATPAWS